MPSRIQRKREKGWTAPIDAQGRKPLYVGRGTPWGNPWAVTQTDTGTGWAVNWTGKRGYRKPIGLNSRIPADDRRDAHALAVELYEMWLHSNPELMDQAREQLAGRDLMCWCHESYPCHADVLLALANPETTR
ncbi:DUF4326 domain-containing protein [Streptomyces sp. 8L]|uniref:DUF4326 domain-containing protein n=1 Tax=Streptomyces sp. 8L TaxID=2877242 RepID=UPI001CD1A734|nr:DUF4326 domain-containing protein [Streptomyces sp. 8L]MCA1222441.1 DUF4326 domain-containing protein [Streptomyces sp. 8L]